MSDDGVVQVGPGQITIDGDGSLFLDGEQVTTLRVMTFPPDTPMRKLGTSGFVPVDRSLRPIFADAEGTVVQQGALELSNVDPTRATIEMLSATRQYEAAQRLVQINDSILERAVNDVGRV